MEPQGSMLETLFLYSHDLKNLVNWLKANNTSLNVRKTELVLFTSPKKQLDCDLKIKLN